MNAAVMPMFRPDVAAMTQHVEHLFGGHLGGYHGGLVELAWTATKPDAQGRYKLSHARLFATDQIDELVEEAARLNAVPMCNVYIGAALRRASTPPFARTGDPDAWALTALYADLDDADAVAAVKDRYQAAKPTMVVLTGKEPHQRAQLWWRLEEPCDDPQAWQGMLRDVAGNLQGDMSVCNAGRVMRLAGSVAWPVKPGRTAVELTEIIPLKSPGLPSYRIEQISKAFPSLPESERPTPPAPGIAETLRKAADGQSFFRTVNTLALQSLAAWVPSVFGTDAIYQQGTGAWRVPSATLGRNLEEDLSLAPQGIVDFGVHDLGDPHRGKRTPIDVVMEWGGAPDAKGAAFWLCERLGVQPDAVGWRAGGGEAEGKAEETASTGASGNLILSPGEFIGGFTPPEYLVDGILQRGYLYSLTARTGHGKTAVTMMAAQAVARGQPVHGRVVKQGSVLFLAGENPDDIRARYLVLAAHHGFKPEDAPVHFIAGVVDVAACMDRIRAEAANIPDLRMVIVDTAAAYFRGDDGNSNAQQGAYARLLRQLTFLPGLPAVLVNCHPVKNAGRENLVPVGGGAFLNEVDGNLTLWANTEKQVTLHWQGKFRGPEFEPLTFKIETVTCETVKDAEGRLMPSVVALPVGEIEIAAAEARTEDDALHVLALIARNPRLSISNLAIKAGWIGATGKPQKSKVAKILEWLRAEKLVELKLGRYRVTKAGENEVGIGPDEDWNGSKKRERFA